MEVNRRVAAHMKGKAAPAHSGTAEHAGHATGSRAAKAAARVAQRFAQAPSYSEMLASEARAAVEAAEAASFAAQEAHAKAQMVLAGIEAAANPEPGPQPVLVPVPDAFPEPQAAEVVPFASPLSPSPVSPSPAFETATLPEAGAEPFAIRWDSDLPARMPLPAEARASHGPGLFDEEPETWEQTETGRSQPPEIAVIEPAQPIFGNVIEFPRQLVATRKVRPHLAEGPLASASSGAQLSIFEVDPGAISVGPEVDVPKKSEQADWGVPEWSTMRLAPAPEPEFELPDEPEPKAQPAPEIELASLSRRLLASVVDITLVAGAIVAAAALAANNSTALPGLRTVEIGSLVALLVAAAAYKVLFFTLARATPGMKFARLALCTLDGGIPTRAQRLARLAALVLSILPVGLGFAWAIFDDQHLAWHDRISRTYLRVG